MSTPITEQDAQLKAILAHPSYRLAHEDHELLTDDDSRPIRLQLELLKPERYLRRHKIQSTVVVFGSARVPSPAQAQATLAKVGAKALSNPGDDGLTVAMARAHQQVRQSHYYEEARRFSAIVSLRFQEEGWRDFVVVTGGGPGTMDELFEVLTLVQTGKVRRVPIVLVGTDFWHKAINFEFLIEEGFVSAQDAQLFTVVDKAEEIVATLQTFYGGKPPVQDAALD